MNEIEYLDVIWIVAGGAGISLVLILLACTAIDFIRKLSWLGKFAIFVGILLVFGVGGYFGYAEYDRFHVYYQLGIATRYQQENISLEFIPVDFRENEELRQRMLLEVERHATDVENARTGFDITAVRYEGVNWYHFDRLVIDYQLHDRQKTTQLVIDLTPDSEVTLEFCKGLVANRQRTQGGLLNASAANY